jgi:UDP-2-acetamido-3-amino-2,3-dideoxy-glucuronate N-acetyltransferase
MSIYIHPTAEVHPDSQIGEGTKIWHHAQVREKTKIGSNCVIGKGVYIDVNVRLGNNVKIQNGVSVYNGVDVEDNVFIGPNATFTNDLYPRATSVDWKVVRTRLRSGCSVGANATVVCGVVIGAYAMVAAGAVVSTNVPPFALVSGNPSRIVGSVCMQGHKMRQINSVEEKLLFECPICNQRLSFSAHVEVNNPSQSE